MPGIVYLTPGGSENEKIQMSKRAAEMSHLIKEMLEEDEEEMPEIPLPNVKKDALLKVVEFCERHVDSPMEPIIRPIRTANMVEIAGEWDANFIDLDQKLLFDVILAANYLDLPDLLSLGCAKIASMIKGRTPDEIKDIFHIEKNSTPEEEEQVRRENSWIFDIT